MPKILDRIRAGYPGFTRFNDSKRKFNFLAKFQLIKSSLIFGYSQNLGDPANNSNFFRKFLPEFRQEFCTKFRIKVIFSNILVMQTLKAALIFFYLRDLGHMVKILAKVLVILGWFRILGKYF